LSKYLEQKYGDNDDDIDDIDYIQEDINTNNKESASKLSAFEILTMKEDELNKIMPINDTELIDDEDKLKESFKYIPNFSHNGNNKKRSKKKKSNKYFKVPKINDGKKKKKGNQQRDSGLKKLSNNSRFTLKCKDSKKK